MSIISEHLKPSLATVTGGIKPILDGRDTIGQAQRGASGAMTISDFQRAEMHVISGKSSHKTPERCDATRVLRARFEVWYGQDSHFRPTPEAKTLDSKRSGHWSFAAYQLFRAPHSSLDLGAHS